MKYVILASLLALPVASYAQQSNIITFKGQVDNETCTVAVNGTNSAPIILLQTAKASDLDAVGKTAMATEFELQLTGCGAANTATAQLVGNNVTNSGNLGNTGTAQNVSIQILDNKNNNAPIVFSGSSAVAAGEDTALTNASGAIPLTAQYYAEDATVVAGTVQATVQYAVTYN
ncbi:fimbrial protein [Orbaceae bacterium ac157xtp]